MNNRKQQILERKKTRIEINSFQAEGGVSEHHLMIHVTEAKLSFAEQLKALFEAYDSVLTNQLQGAHSVFKRYFLSDAANQANTLLAMSTEGAECAVSVVQQAPLNGTKVALWCYLIDGVVGRMLPDGMYEVRHGAYRDFWSVGNLNQAANSEYQTRLLLSDYVMKLNEQGLRLADHCVRTWFFVQDIDRNYAGVVKARNEVFLTQNLTSETHFIASTGIGGGNPQVESLVLMDAYAVDGLQPGQMHYLYARTHLNPTYEYGVSFERGTYVDYGDRRKVYISGTASINNKGEILYEGDIRRQTTRMLENVEMLLKEADCSYDDVDQMTVYLRDPADYEVVKEMYDERFPRTPKVLVNAFVCRPGWLIEMECMATKRMSNQAFAAF
ncbi:MAG: Rid family hydrolase [Bacteroidales bacterium]|nr:Rid family hydrolase [Bacteroidales bacterium]